MPEASKKQGAVNRSQSDVNSVQSATNKRSNHKSSSSKLARRKTTDGIDEAKSHNAKKSSSNQTFPDSTNGQRLSSRHSSIKRPDSVESNGVDHEAIIDEENEPMDTEHQRVEKRRLKSRGSFIDRMKTAIRSSTTNLKRASSQGKLSVSNLFGSSRRHRGSTTSLRNANPENVIDVGNLEGYSESDVSRCLVSLLDGQNRQFRFDKRECVGAQLLNSVAAYLNLAEKEHFGLVYYDKREVWHWLEADKKVSSQLDGQVPFLEFQCRFYPIDPCNDLKEDLSRYYLGLQVRQDILSGKLPCSYLTLAILGSYAVQADLGDQTEFESVTRGTSQSRTAAHDGASSGHIVSGDYLKEYPIAPTSMQTPQVLEKVADLHRSLHGMLPEECDAAFLDEARKLALYGMDLHRARDDRGIEVMLGVSGRGIVVYHDRLRMRTYTWPRILKVSYRRTTITITLRGDQFGAASGWRSIGSRSDLSTFLGTAVTSGRRLDPTASFEETYRLRSYKMAKRCWRTVVEQHGFFRLHAPDLPAPPKRPLLKRLATSMRDLTGTYSGTTQAQLRDRDLGREAPSVRRSSSIRHSGGAFGSWASVNNLRRSQSLLLQAQSGANSKAPAPVPVALDDPDIAHAAEDDDLDTVAIEPPQTGRKLMAIPSPTSQVAPAAPAAPATQHSEKTIQVPPKAKRRKSKVPVATAEERSDPDIENEKLSPEAYRELETRTLRELSSRQAFVDRSLKEQIERSEFLIIKQKSTAKVVYVDEDGEQVDADAADCQSDNNTDADDELL